MALTDYNGVNSMVMPVAPMNGYNGSGGFMGMDGGYFFYMMILFFFFMFGGWGNGYGYGNGNGMMPYMMNNTTNNDVQRGFDQQAVMNSLSGIQSSLAQAEVGRCSLGNNVISALNNGFNQVQSSFANSSYNELQNMNTLAMSLQNCCCENRAGLADLKYTIATENCADRAAVSDGIRDVMAASTANTQALLNTINGGIQSIQDKLCQQEIDALKSENANLRSAANLTALRDTQEAQTNAILAGQAAQTAILSQRLNPAPIPAYVVQNPNCCTGAYQGCGCGGAF